MKQQTARQILLAEAAKHSGGNASLASALRAAAKQQRTRYYLASTFERAWQHIRHSGSHELAQALINQAERNLRIAVAMVENASQQHITQAAKQAQDLADFVAAATAEYGGWQNADTAACQPPAASKQRQPAKPNWRLLDDGCLVLAVSSEVFDDCLSELEARLDDGAEIPAHTNPDALTTAARKGQQAIHCTQASFDTWQHSLHTELDFACRDIKEITHPMNGPASQRPADEVERLAELRSHKARLQRELDKAEAIAQQLGWLS